MSARLELELAPVPDELLRMAQEVEGFCERQDFSAAVTYKVGLVLDELVTNILSHGIAPGTTEPIRIALVHDRGELAIEIRDRGRPFDPRSAPEPDLVSPLQDRKIGGLGVHFMRTYMDSVDWRHVDGHNILTMRKRVAEDGQANAGR